MGSDSLGGGGGGGGGLMGGEKKVQTGANQGHGFVCGESAGAQYGKYVGLVAGTVAGSMFGVPMLGMAGAQVGKSLGSQFDPSVCTPKADPGMGKHVPMPPGSEGGGDTGADATGSATEKTSPTKTPDTSIPNMQFQAKYLRPEEPYDPYSEMAKFMTFGGSGSGE